jgi:hypothetical protein
MRLFEFQDPRLKKIHRFARWAISKLGIQGEPTINYSNDKGVVDRHRSFGSTKPSGDIWVYLGDRNTADILRTLCHELVHYRQFEKGITMPETDQERHRVEDQANAIAGRMMRAYGLEHQDIYEGRIGSIQPDVAEALPASYAITCLKNQDPYLQYRFSVAIASAKGRAARDKDNIQPFQRASVWGQDEMVVSFDPHIKDWIDDALEQMNYPTTAAKQVASTHSREMTDIYKTSPVQAFNGYGKKEQ